MSEYVFILGAGASAHAQVPLMARFLDQARKLYSSGLENLWKGHFERVFEILIALQSVHSKTVLDLNNIEAVFTTFELGQTIQKLPGVEDGSFEAAIDSLKMVILHTIEGSMLFPLTSDGIVHAPRDYEAFASLLKQLKERDQTTWAQVSVITFNYDVGMKVAFMQQGMPYEYCLTRSGAFASAIKLLKLHGSVNWGKVRDADEIVAYPMEKLVEVVQLMGRQLSDTREHVHLGLSSSFQEGTEKFTGREVEESPIIVPPGLFKTEYQGSISRVWQQAAKELEEAEEIIVIGYSLPDTDFFFRNLFALGTVGRKFIRRFAVFNPEKEVESRFSSLLGPGVKDRFDYQATKFDQGIKKMAEWYLS